MSVQSNIGSKQWKGTEMAVSDGQGTDRPMEADPVDVDEQQTPAAPESGQELTPSVHLSAEVPEADALEQAVEVPEYDEEDFR
jgi:hypothetical protein